MHVRSLVFGHRCRKTSLRTCQREDQEVLALSRRASRRCFFTRMITRSIRSRNITHKNETLHRITSETYDIMTNEMCFGKKCTRQQKTFSPHPMISRLWHIVVWRCCGWCFGLVLLKTKTNAKENLVYFLNQSSNRDNGYSPRGVTVSWFAVAS